MEKLREPPKRIVHLSHFIPNTCILKNGQWELKSRRGHSALNSGVRSLNSEYENIQIGYTGICYQDNEILDEFLMDHHHKESLKEALLKIKKIPIFLSNEVAFGHYEELWPTFHYILTDIKPNLRSQKMYWDSYVKVNQKFAQEVINIYQPGDYVWVHDYHLMLVPEMIRKVLPTCNIGFFLHAPFPSSEVFRCLSKRKEILLGLLGANLIGFQTYPYLRHFISSCTRVLGLESTPKGIDFHGGVVSVGTFPIGIDVDISMKNRKSAGVLEKIKVFKELYAGKKIIFGRDKLDKATGILQKFRTFEQFLIKYPEWQGNIVTSPLIQSLKLETEISEFVSKLNGTYGSVQFTPVHYFHHNIEKEEYYALLSIADVALITSMRDGMNTTSHEFIVCQNETHSPLILSEFTGTAESLSASILVNPSDFTGVADAINMALKMPADQKAIRHKALYEYINKNDAKNWAHGFLKEMINYFNSGGASVPTPILDLEKVTKHYTGSKKRLLLFDYDGTLTDIRTVPSAAIPEKIMLEGLTRLAKDPINVVWVISGRDQKALEEWMGCVPNLGMSAEHGCYLKNPGSKEWINLTDETDLSWKNDVIEIFTYYTERTHGSFIEHKRSSLTWHYRMADSEYGIFQAKECQNHLENSIVSKLPVEILVGKKNIEVRPGEIVKKLLIANSDCDFVFCAGDDKTDEDMFRALKLSDIPKEKLFTCTIGSANKLTSALWHVDSPTKIIEVLHLMADSK